MTKDSLYDLQINENEQCTLTVRTFKGVQCKFCHTETHFSVINSFSNAGFYCHIMSPLSKIDFIKTGLLPGFLS